MQLSANRDLERTLPDAPNILLVQEERSLLLAPVRQRERTLLSAPKKGLLYIQLDSHTVVRSFVLNLR